MEELKIHAHSLKDEIQAYEDSVVLAQRESLVYNTKQGFKFPSYLGLLLASGFTLYKLGLFKCIVRPFHIAFRFCFDNRPNMQI